MSRPGPLLSVEQLHAGYGRIPILHGVSLAVWPGEVVAVIGPNGAGKSTTFKAIVGLVRPERGEVVFDGARITALRPDEVLRRGLAYVPQGRIVFPQMTVLENLEMGAYLERDRAAIEEGLERVYALFPVLRERRRAPATALSGGQQQMAAIGRALMANPRILLCDEISLGLAPIVIRAIYAAIPAIKDGGTSILLVEQDIVQAMAVADRVYCFQEGRLSLSGRPAELTRERIHAAYFGA